MPILLDEILEQPQVLRGLIETGYAEIAAIAAEIRARGVRQVLIAARGTSDNAATYAKYLLEIANGLPVALAAPSVYTLYERSPRLHDTLVVAVSQSGRSPDIVAVVADARRQGMLTLAVTNAPGSPLAAAAERVIDCRAGEERSVAATKSYTATLAALALLSVALAADDGRYAELRAMPEVVAETLALHVAAMAARAERYRYMEDCAVIARGYNYATAFEVALKLKEMTYSRAQAYSSADFLHGPIAAVAPGYPVVLVAPAGRTLADSRALAEELRRRDAELIAISDDEALLAAAQTPLRLPAAVPEWLSPITAVLPGQLLAYRLALARGLDPEQPRGLRKITETR
jgi:glucosamine--fructose-6-phosphate aminotransferase (isomerizing)